jgi:phosphoribosylformylglycinamidine synthase
VFPTPVIGMLGLMDDKQQFTTLAFRQAGDLIYLIGRSSGDISGSQYLYSFHGRKDSTAPPFSLADECALHAVVRELRGRVCLESLQDVSDGGLFTALLECALPGRLGFDVVADLDVRRDAYWFGEAQGRAVLSVDPLEEEMLLRFLGTSALPWCKLGVVTSGSVVVDGQPYKAVEHYAGLFDNSIGEAMGQDD